MKPKSESRLVWTADAHQLQVVGRYHQELQARDLPYRRTADWSIQGGEVRLDKVLLQHDGEYTREMVGYLGEALVFCTLGARSLTVFVAAPTEEAARAVQFQVLEQVPEVEVGEAQAVSFNFWHHTANGPERTRRVLDVPRWAEIEPNYAALTGQRLQAMYAAKEPTGGKLFVWHGLPGTGKTWALRALAWEWRHWVDCHYLIEPEKFFGLNVGDLMQVVLRGEDMPVMREVGEAVGQRWKLLILEDAGEMLRVDAKEQVGQALPRLLNLVDGLIGQGLHLMVLITTNEELGQMHPAVTRHGRMAMEVRFDAFALEEAKRWLGSRNPELDASGNDLTLADLYARLHAWTPKVRRKEAVGFRLVE